MDHALLPNFGLLLIGIVLLVLGGELLVRGSVAIANHFKISSLVIGLTVVAFGTSAPELIVSLSASITGHPEIALGNVIGSNIANIALVLAITVIILPMPVISQTIKRSWPIMFFSGAILYLFMSNSFLGHTEGFVLFILLIVFIINSMKSGQKFTQKIPNPKQRNQYKIGVYLIMVLVASIGLAIGSKFLVDGASGIAANMGISERIISITIVAFGTSIPELTASVVAAFKKETDISVGNIIGSNIFNVFAVIGITASVHNIPFRFRDFRIDLLFMLAFYILLLLFILPRNFYSKLNLKNITSRFREIKGGNILRVHGVLFVLLYALYIFLIFKKTPVD